jgi:DeoR family transcriptional regulator of aga operon
VVDRERRWSTLLELLAANGRLSVADASRTLGVSVATIRRDFAALAAQQLAARTHGGVVSTSVAYALPARYRSAAREDPKDRVAARASQLIPVGSVVGLNGGTTTTLTARHLARRTDLAASADPQPLTVVTNALNIAVDMVLRRSSVASPSAASPGRSPTRSPVRSRRWCSSSSGWTRRCSASAASTRRPG